jgi:four helix bundle protein
VKSDKSFEDLECWKAAARIRKKVRTDTAEFPLNEPLAGQMQMTSRAITQKIAESFGRTDVFEKIQLCLVSCGLLFALTDLYIVAVEENYLSEDIYDRRRKNITEALVLLQNYLEELKKQLNQKRLNHNYTLPLTISF